MNLDSSKQYVIDNWGKKPTSEIATALSISVSALNSRLCRWRKCNPGLFPLLVKGSRIAYKSGKYKQTVLDNYSKMSIKELATLVGVSADTLRGQISIWRSEGEDLPKRRIVHKAGSTTVRNIHGVPVEHVKDENGRWHAVPGQKIPKAPDRYLKGKAPASERLQGDNIRAITEVVKIKRDQNTVPFFIPELRMTVYVPASANREEVRRRHIARWQSNYQSAKR